ncbi:MAG: PH domain-containing protein [Psychrobium sp.]
MDNWQRVSKVSIVDFFIKNLIQLVSASIYAIPAVWASSNTLKENLDWVALGGIGLLTLLIVGACLQYYFFKYRLKGNNIEIYSGVIFKKHLDLPFTRIQNVKLITPVYFRPFNYTTMELDTAGSAKNEAKIVAVPMDKANALKQQILTYQATHSAETEETEENAENANERVMEGDEVLLNERSLMDLVIHGLTNNRVLIFLAMLAPMAETIFEYASQLLLSVGFDLDAFLNAEHPWWQLSLYFIGSLILAYMLVMLLSIIGAIIAFYGYKLTKRDNNYIQRSGLLSIHEVVMKKPRLQMIVRQQDWLDVLIKRINLKFEQIGGLERQGQNSLRNKLMVPSIKENECRELTDEMWPSNKVMDVTYQSISRRFIFRTIALFVAPVTIVICTIALINDVWPLLPLAAIFFTVASVLTWCRWKRWGYAMDDEYVYIRKGLLGVNYYCFTIEKTQMVKFKQSVFLRRHTLCHVNFVTAASALTIPFIPQDIGWNMMAKSLYQVESLKKNWM